MKLEIDFKKPVYKLQNGTLLNPLQFISYLEGKVFKTIRKHKFFSPCDVIVVAVSGGKDSLAVLYLVQKYLKKRNFNAKLVALAIDEGIKNYREDTLLTLKKFCEKYCVPLKIVSYKLLYGKTQDENVNSLKLQGKNISPCNICGVYRRNALNSEARKLRATKLVTGHNLDDEAQTILLNVFKNNFKILARLGPVNGIVKNEKFVPRVKPLYFCSEKEIKLYTLLKQFDLKYSECPYSKNQFRNRLSVILNELEERHGGVKNSIVNFYLEIQELLKEKYVGDFGKSFSFCSVCSEPSQNPVCNTCKMKEEVK